MTLPQDPSNPRPPKWREDFPYESEGDDFITRRDFTRFLCVISAGFATGNAWILGKSLINKQHETPTIPICKVDDLEPGNWMIFKYPDDKTPAMLIRRLSGDYIAYMQKCTHLACPVAYEKNRDGGGEGLSCHCHNGHFDIDTGEGIAGPPKGLRPLPQIKLLFNNDTILAVGFEYHRGIGRS